jgi:hypothetical protein
METKNNHRTYCDEINDILLFIKKNHDKFNETELRSFLLKKFKIYNIIIESNIEVS